MNYRINIFDNRFDRDYLAKLTAHLANGSNLNQIEWSLILRVGFNSALFYADSFNAEYHKRVSDHLKQSGTTDIGNLRIQIKAFLKSSVFSTNDALELLQAAEQTTSFYYSELVAINREARMKGVPTNPPTPGRAVLSLPKRSGYAPFYVNKHQQ